ncbi:MAG: VOC family protein [Candidatus Magasanikiibacteriota bacterium]
MQKITPHLWFDKEAKEAAKFYTSIFKNSQIKNMGVIENTPSGDADIITIDLSGQEFMLINAGPYFKFTPAVSFLVACDTKEEVDELWKPLSQGGLALMELDTYPFSERYGWIQDKYGLSWQIMLIGDIKTAQKITPALMFVGKQSGRAEEAVNFYTSIFPKSKIDHFMRYQTGEDPEKEGTIKHAGFSLLDMEFGAMDSANKHNFTFNEAVSLIVYCDDQEEIDYYWENLSAVPESEQCGWLKDKFGFSWQIVPSVMKEMMSTGDKDKLARVTKAFLQMKKFDIAELEKAYNG